MQRNCSSSRWKCLPKCPQVLITKSKPWTEINFTNPLTQKFVSVSTGTQTMRNLNLLDPWMLPGLGGQNWNWNVEYSVFHRFWCKIKVTKIPHVIQFLSFFKKKGTWIVNQSNLSFAKGPTLVAADNFDNKMYTVTRAPFYLPTRPTTNPSTQEIVLVSTRF